MNLYLANGTYVGTQADARAITKDFTAVEVPTDKAGLIAYLNGLSTKPVVPARVTPVVTGLAVDHLDGDPFNNRPENIRLVEPRENRRDMSATAVLSRSDGPINVDEIVETICGSSGYALKRFAGAVACAFTRLGA